MKKIMAVYDEDPFYAERLSDYINRREDGIFSARAFTSRKRLEEFARDHGIDVLLTGTLSEGGFPGLPSVQRILLTEEEVRAGEGGGDVVEVYEKYQDADVLNICVADGLSGTYHGALSARDMVENRDRITVFNSRTLCGPHRYMVEKAQKMKEEGKGIPEILEWLKSAAEKTESFLIPQDFGFLKRGGRLTPVAAALGSVLKLKPVMRLTEDGTRLDKFFVKRTMSAAVSGIMDHMKKKGIDGRYLLYIVHAAAPKEAGAIREMIEAEFKGIQIQMMDLSPVFVAQGGPGCVAIQYIER